jgi:hypothetical protein
MPLVGNLRDFGLSDFLYLVDRGYKTGCLHLTRGDETASLYFDKGKLLAVARNDARLTVADLLVRRGKISGEQARHALACAGQHVNGNLSSLLVDLNLVTQAELQAVLQQHIEESVYGLLAWQDGEFRFEQNQRPDPDMPIAPVPVQVENLIMEGVRRIDEWSRIRDRIPSMDMIVRFNEQPGERRTGVNLSAEEWRVFARINGKATIEEIAQKANMGEFDVCRIIYGFVTAGLVEVVRRPRPIPGAERPGQEAPRLRRSLVARIINRIRGM